MTARLSEGVNSLEVARMNLRQLQQLTMEDFRGEMAPLTLRHVLTTCDALWLHSGNPKTPHAELTSGKCSNGFVDVLRVIRYPNLCEILSGQLVRKFRSTYRGHVDWVVGSDHAGATLSFAVAIQLFMTKHDFTEKGPDKTQVWKRFVIDPEETVLQVEELITTTGTLSAVREGIRKGNPHPVSFAPIVLALVHRSDVYDFEGAPIVYLAHYDIETWEPADCPLCKAGSVRLRPKENWAKLTGRE